MHRTTRATLALLLGLSLGIACATTTTHSPRSTHGAHHGHGGAHDTERYIAHLESPERAAWQKPDEVVAALKLRGDETVADIGAGSGYFAFRFAGALPEGNVAAIDIDEALLEHVRERAAEEKVGNIVAIRSAPDDPSVPSGADLIFICNVLHHIPEREAWLTKLYAQTEPGTEVAILEFFEGDLPVGPPAGAKIPKPQIVAELATAGFALDREIEGVTPYQHFLVFERTGGTEAQ